MNVGQPALTASWLALILLVPGAVALALGRHPSRGPERLALASGLSVALWPCALLWCTLLGWRWTAAGLQAALLGGGCLVVWLWWVGRGRSGRPVRRPTMAVGVLGLVVSIALVARAVQARELVVPAWVDGLHHTVVTQVIAERGVVPADLSPYVAVEGFYYHFGFHSVAAALALAARLPSARAVLWTGQALGALTLLGVYLLARRSVRDDLAAVAAVAVPATLFLFPAYYVSWSRYTQLAGLVALPAAWVLLADARRARSLGPVALAGAAASGLVLDHYRVAVIYALGVALWLVWRVWADRARWRSVAVRTTAVGAVALAVAGPWLLGPLAAGAAALAGEAKDGSVALLGQLPGWLFASRHSGAWMLAGALGLSIGLGRRRPVAGGAVLLVGLSWLVAERLGGGEWMLPTFSLAIALYLPVSIGIGLLVEAMLDTGTRLASRAPLRRAVAVGIVGAAAWGMVATRDIRNPDTVIAHEQDLAAAAWIAARTEPGARFLVGTTHWHMGTYRGIDGGYWLPLLAGRWASVPPALYPYGRARDVERVTAWCRVAARGDDLSDRELVELMHRLEATHVYVGPAARDRPGAFSPERLRRVAGLREVYDRGGVHVFQLVGGRASPGSGRAEPRAPVVSPTGTCQN